MEWQPIETVPKETEVLVWFGPTTGVKSATYTDKDGDGIWFWCVTDGKFDPHPGAALLRTVPDALDATAAPTCCASGQMRG